MTALYEEVADVLDGAADYIEKHGWTQFRAGGCGGPSCAKGAIYEVSARPGGPVFRYHDAVAALSCRVGFNVARWNDAPEQTAENVIRTMRDVAAEQRVAVSHD